MNTNNKCDINEETSIGIANLEEAQVPKSFKNKKVNYLKITDLAKEKIKEILANRGRASSGVKVSIRTKGCSGLSYKIEFADYNVNFTDSDELAEFDSDIRVFIDIKASLFIIGTEMDYEVEQFKEGFIFKNPNEKGKCGCGSSFFV